MNTNNKYGRAFAFCFLISLASNAIAASERIVLDMAKAIAVDQPPVLKVLYPDGSAPNIQPIAKLFTEATGVDIDLVKTSVDDINTRMMLGVTTESYDFDIALPATFGIPDLAEAGALADLTNFATKYESKIQYQPSLYSLGDRYKNRLYGYQTDGDTYVMFYQRDWLNDPKEQAAFKQATGRELSEPVSWAELDELMAFFHRPEQGQYGGVMFRTPRYMVWEWWIRFHAKGALPFDDKMGAQVNSDAGISALAEMIAATQSQHPSVKTNGLVDNWKVYAQGKAFANIGWGGSQKHFNQADSKVKGRLSFAPTPEASYFNWGWNYVVSKFSRNQELAYLFALYATLPKPSTEAVQQAGFFDPFRSEHYQDEKIRNVYSPDFLAAHKVTMERAIPDLYIEERGKYIEVLEEAMVSALEGHISAQEAMQFVARRWDSLTEKIGRDQQLEQWHFLKAKYPKH